MKRPNAQHGFALITVLLLLLVLMAMVTAYFFVTGIELATTQASANSTTGFYAAEAGLNLRGEKIRNTFQGYNRPAGALLDPETACKNGAGYAEPDGTDNFACEDYTLNSRRVVSYVVQDPANLDPDDTERLIVIPSGDKFAGLNAIQYRYEVLSEAIAPSDTRPEARLGMVFRSRLVPVFQFAAFYNKDLEISPGEDMTLNGRVHVNGDLYLNAGGSKTLGITGKVTVAQSENARGGDLYRRRKNNTSCDGFVRVNDANDANGTLIRTEPTVNCAGRIPQTTLNSWNGQILTQLDTITSPEMEAFDIGKEGWNQADLRIALDVRTSSPKIIVPNKAISASNPYNLTANTSMTNALNSCTSAAGTPKPYTLMPGLTGTNRVAEGSTSFRDTREGRVGGTSVPAGGPPSKAITMLEIDLQGLLSCMHTQRTILFGESPSTQRNINDTSQGGLILFLTVIGDRSGNASSLYGVRVRNGEQLRATTATPPAIKGLTIISDQAAYIQGHYNRDDLPGQVWKPASFLVDTLNVLSENWRTITDAESGSMVDNRIALDTRINTALLAGTTTTGNQEGTAGQGGNYNGGLENYPRLHERWSGRTLTYKGSFVSLARPRRSNSDWPNTGVIYNAPTRDWSYDVRFNDPDNLPPLAPRFVYLRQERFARNFEQ